MNRMRPFVKDVPFVLGNKHSVCEHMYFYARKDGVQLSALCSLTSSERRRGVYSTAAGVIFPLLSPNFIFFGKR